MKSRKSIILKQITFEKRSIQSILDCILTSEYIPEKGEGFIVNESSDSIFYATYIYHTPVFRTKFDNTSFSTVREKEIITNIVEFSIDIQKGFIAIFSSGNLARFLLTVLGKLFDFKISLNDVSLDFESLIQKSKIGNLSFEISSLKYKNFEITPEIIGTVWIKTPTPTVLNSVITNYNGDLVFISGCLKMKNDVAYLGIYDSGSFSVSCSDDDFEDIVDLIETEVSLGGN